MAKITTSTCPPPVTITVTSNPPSVTLADADPVSISSVFSYDSQIGSVVVLESSQDRPTGDPPETTPLFFTYTASGVAVVATETPGASFYDPAYSTNVPVAVTTVSFPPADTVFTVYSTTYTTVYQTTTTYYTTTTLPSAARHVTISTSVNGTINTSGLEKRQTCSMVFAQINNAWASWCGNWDGTTTVSYSTYQTTVLETTPYGVPPIPESVYDPSGTLESGSIPTSTSSTYSSMLSEPSTAAPSIPSSDGSTISSDTQASMTVFTATVMITELLPTFTKTVYDQPGNVSSTSSASEASSSCGQVGDFLVTFDDLPPVSATNASNITYAPPIWDRYDHFYWSSGYGFAPPPKSNYSTASGGLMAEFNPAEAVPVFNDTQGRDLPGSFGAGQRVTNNIYWFDATSAYLGCNNTDPNVQCYITATGYRWTTMSALDGSVAGAEEIVADAQNFTIPPCIFPPCMLTQVYFDTDQFTGLSTINLQAYAAGEVVGFFLDSFDLTWANNSCAAGLERQMIRK